MLCCFHASNYVMVEFGLWFYFNDAFCSVLLYIPILFSLFFSRSPHSIWFLFLFLFDFIYRVPHAWAWCVVSLHQWIDPICLCVCVCTFCSVQLNLVCCLYVHHVFVLVKFYKNRDLWSESRAKSVRFQHSFYTVRCSVVMMLFFFRCHFARIVIVLMVFCSLAHFI